MAEASVRRREVLLVGLHRAHDSLRLVNTDSTTDGVPNILDSSRGQEFTRNLWSSGVRRSMKRFPYMLCGSILGLTPPLPATHLLSDYGRLAGVSALLHYVAWLAPL